MNIVTEAGFLRLCSKDDPACDTVITGDFVYGDMFRGTSRGLEFHLKNTGLIDPIFVDFRIRSGGVLTDLTLDFSLVPQGALTGDAPNLGIFSLTEFEPGTGFNRFVDSAFGPGEVRRMYLTFTPALALAPGPLRFDILIDAVDAVE